MTSLIFPMYVFNPYFATDSVSLFQKKESTYLYILYKMSHMVHFVMADLKRCI